MTSQPRFQNPVFLAVVVALLAWTTVVIDPAFPQEADAPDTTAETEQDSTQLTQEEVERHLKQVEASTELEDALKTATEDVCKQAIAHLKATLVQKGKADGFKKDIEDAPKKSRELRAKLEQAVPLEETPLIEIRVEHTVEALEVRQASEQSKRETETKKLEALDRELGKLSSSGEELRTREEEIQEEIKKIATDLETEAPADEPPLVTGARTMEIEARRNLRSAELERIAQEILSLPMRVELRKAEREEQAEKLKRLDFVLKSFQDEVNERRDLEAQAAQARAEQAQREAALKHPFLEAIAGKNSELTQERIKISNENARASKASQHKETEATTLAQDSDHTGSQLKEAGVSAIGGNFLRDERKRIARMLRDNAKVWDRWNSRIPEVSTRRFEVNLEQRRLTDMDEAVAELFLRDEAPAEADRPRVEPEIRKLLESRRDEIYAELSKTYSTFYTTLKNLETHQRQLRGTAESYAQKLDEWLLWVASSEPISLAYFAKLKSSLGWLFERENWAHVFSEIRLRSQESTVLFALFGLALIALVLGRGKSRREIESTADVVGRPDDDHFGLTLRALLGSILFAAPLPLLLAFTGWVLAGANVESKPFVNAVGKGLLSASIVTFVMTFFRTLSMPRGVGEIHLRWRQETVNLLRRNLTWAQPIMVTSTFFTMFTANVPDREIQASLGLTFFVLAMLTQFVFLQRVLRPIGGVAEYVMKRNPDAWLARLRYIWYPLAVGLPLVFAAAAILGYTYTAFELERRVIMTGRVVVSAILLNYIAIRWLVVAERRLALERAQEQREAEEQAAEAATQNPEDASETEKGTVEVPEVDISTINDQSKKLLRTFLGVFLILGLWGVWAPVFPALQFLDTVELWETTETTKVEGKNEVSVEEFTLQDLAVALIMIVLTMAAAKNLPGVLEIVILKNLPLEASMRYAITTIAQYALTVVGIIVAFKAIGIGWSKIQWLIAALSVGVGFGLQEIVANFICGLILLFERPIRVGDIVSVGNVMGTVSRIRIRATTITNWDRMDYVVPNKELITGRLLNWTLTNTINRIVVNVGVAYGSDMHRARQILLDVAAKHPLIMDDPAPIATFEGFGNSTLNLVLRCYLPDFAERLETIHQLHEQVNQAFEKEGIEIAFPQLDLHLKGAQGLPVEPLDNPTKK